MSRVGHTNEKVYDVLLSMIISRVIREYPQQALWLFTSVVKSTKKNREARGRTILDRLKVCLSYPLIVVAHTPVLHRAIPRTPKRTSQISSCNRTG